MATERTASDAHIESTDSQHRWLLLSLLGAIFLANVDTAVVNIATPSIHSTLNASRAELVLIVSGYMVAYGTLLITCARLGAMYGHKAMYLLGMAAFTIASVVCGLAPTGLVLVLARIVQGAAAALMVAQVLTGIQLHFDGQARARAIGQYTMVLAGSAVVGQALGGLLVAANVLGTAWRPIFLINLPIGIIVILAAARFLPADQPRGPQRLDLPGVALLSAALLLLVVPLVLGPDAGWAPWIWVLLAASIPAFVLFVVVERRLADRDGNPVINIHLLARPAISWALITQVGSFATYFAILFVVALYLQRGFGLSPAYSGLALVPWVALFGVAGPVLGRLPARARGLAAPVGSLALGLTYVAIAVALVAGATSGWLLIALLGLGGLTFGIQFAGTVGHLTSSVGNEHAADMSGLVNTVMRIGSVLGVAAFGTVYLSLAPNPGQQAAVHAFTVVTVLFALTTLAGAVTAYLAIRERAAARQDAGPRRAPAASGGGS